MSAAPRPESDGDGELPVLPVWSSTPPAAPPTADADPHPPPAPTWSPGPYAASLPAIGDPSVPAAPLGAGPDAAPAEVRSAVVAREGVDRKDVIRLVVLAVVMFLVGALGTVAWERTHTDPVPSAPVTTTQPP
jgi:hypothetical protein